MSRKWIAAGLWAALAVAGCGPTGPQPVTVTGDVKLDGKPFGQGGDASIRFEPTDAVACRPADAQIVGGRYTAQVLPGLYKVSVSFTKKWQGKPSPEGWVAGDWVEQLPDRYNVKTTLTSDIAPDKAVHDFALDPK